MKESKHYHGPGMVRSLTHYLFLADPRTYQIVGESNRANPAIIKTMQVCTCRLWVQTFVKRGFLIEGFFRHWCFSLDWYQICRFTMGAGLC